MPVYTILGATGQTGQAILEVLLRDSTPSRTIRCFVRSRAKLLSQKPELESDPSVEIFTGSINDPASLTPCLSGATAVFACIAINENTPGTSIALDTAHTIVASLVEIRNEDPKARLPNVVVLSSATLNEHFMRDFPPVVHWMLLRAAGHIYADLRRAEAYYRLHSSWMKAVFVQPGGLVQGTPKGHIVSTDKEQTPLSFLDLAAGMVEVADKCSEEGTYAWKGVTVVPAKDGTKFPLMVPVYLVMGLVFWYLPFLWTPCRWLGLV